MSYYLKVHTHLIYRSRNFGIEFDENPFKRSNFFRFFIFWEFSQRCLTQANFELSSWNFVHECTNTEWCSILNFVRIGRDLQIIDKFEFFLSWHQILKIRCIHEAFSVRKPKSGNILPQRKKFVKSVRLYSLWYLKRVSFWTPSMCILKKKSANVDVFISVNSFFLISDKSSCQDSW